MSNFLANLARRAAGLPAQIVPRLTPAAQPAMLSAPAPAHDIAAVSEPAQDDFAGEAGHGETNSRRIAPATQPVLTASQRSGPALLGAISHPARRAREHPDIENFVRAADAQRLSAPRPEFALASIAPRAQPKPLPALGSAEATPRTATARDAPSPYPPQATSRTAPAPTRSDADPKRSSRLQRAAVTVELGTAEVAPARAQTQAATLTAMPQGPRDRASPASRVTAKPSSIHVRIGKVEVRASAPAAPLARVSRPKGAGGFAELALARAHLNRNHR